MPLPEAHLVASHPVRRDSVSARAYLLNEPGAPRRTAADPAVLAEIVRFLDVENSARYQPTDSATFCNVYAHDYCALAGVYLPRVWWLPTALAALAAGHNVAPRYGDTVAEWNANALLDWLRDFGPQFGWSMVATVDELQAAANGGQVAVICAKRRKVSASGHIACVVPEQAPPLVARRDPNGIRLPLQSQAGRQNFCFSCGHGRWWEGEQFAAHGFWIHA
jgi:hypothetical protein